MTIQCILITNLPLAPSAESYSSKGAKKIGIHFMYHDEISPAFVSKYAP